MLVQALTLHLFFSFSSPFLLLFLPHSFFFSLHPNSSSFVILSLCPAHSFVFSFLPFFLVLSPHFPPLYTTSYSEQRKVCQACYKVIESYLRGDSRKNENYLARFIKFFQTQVEINIQTHRHTHTLMHLSHAPIPGPYGT